jgi:hypothetical protein
MNDQEAIEAICDAVADGSTSRSAIAIAVGLSPDRATRLIGIAVREGRLKSTGRDRHQSPTFAVCEEVGTAV